MTKSTETFSALNIHKGLTQARAQSLLVAYGENQIERKVKASGWRIFFSQFSSPLILILLIAAGVTFFLKDFVDMFVILASVVLNTILGFYQEYRAQRGLEALSSLLSPQAKVLRDGEYVTVPTTQLVPGDVVSLNAGETIGADGVVLEAYNLMVNEAILTGESFWTAKKACSSKTDPKQQFVSLNERDGKLGKQALYMGTTVGAGSAVMRVLYTGVKTEIGSIARQLSETINEETPLQLRLKKLSTFLTLTVLVVASLIFVMGMAKGSTFEEIFSLSVAVAVSAIPEGLAVSLTAILAISMQRILKKKALVRKLLAAEVLGSVTVICSDKTGTITEGQMRVASFEAVDKNKLLLAASLGNSLNDPLELGMWEWAKETIGKKDLETYGSMIDQLPFDSNLRYAAKLFKHELYVIGAPETLLSFSSLSKKEKNEWQDKIFKLASTGLRVVAFGSKRATGLEKLTKKEVSADLFFLGILAFEDPIRKGVASALKKAREAGVRVKIITGDYRETARGVMKQLGWEVKDSQIMEGDELARMNMGELQRRVDEVVLFARTTPTQKLKIVNALQARGEVVAMTGDGVNDAPALKKADIGVVVSTASDVSKETADVVLLDNNFATIISAIEEGRGIFENLRKVTLYLLSNAFSEMIIILVSLFAHLPLPVTAAQILWINLVDDGLPNLALALDPKDKDLLQRRPRRKSEGLMNAYMYTMMIVVSLVSVLVVGGVFWWYLNNSTLPHARTMAFTTLAIGTLFYALTSRSMNVVFWRSALFSNPSLLMAIVGGFLLQALAIYNPFIGYYLETQPLSLYDWVIIGSVCLGMLLIIELFKMIYLKFFSVRLSSNHQTIKIGN